MESRLGPFRENTLYMGDALSLMPGLPDNSIDLIITDPPFAIDFKAQRLNYNRTGSNVIEGYQEILPEDYREFTQCWIKEASRILSPSGSMYIFSGWNRLKDILEGIDSVGLFTVNHLIWKYQFGVFTKKKFVTSHYHILFVTKNKKNYTFNKIDHYPEDVWEIKREYRKGKKKTPTKLPSEIVRKILMYSSNPGDLVFDPFFGSGTVPITSNQESRRFIGFEIVPDYYEFANVCLKNSKGRLK